MPPGRHAASDGACRAATASAGTAVRNMVECAGLREWSGGESGIRTHGRVSPTHAFQACSFNRSDISPETWLARSGGSVYHGRLASGGRGGAGGDRSRPRGGAERAAAPWTGGGPDSPAERRQSAGVRRILDAGRGASRRARRGEAVCGSSPDPRCGPGASRRGSAGGSTARSASRPASRSTLPERCSPTSRCPAGSLIGPGADGTLNPSPADRGGRPPSGMAGRSAARTLCNLSLRTASGPEGSSAK